MQARQTGSGRAAITGDLLPPEPQRRRPGAMAVRPAVVEDAIFEVVGPADYRSRQSNDNPPKAAGRNAEPVVVSLIGRMAFGILKALERGINGLSTQSFATLSTGLFLLAFWAFGGFSGLSAPAAASAVPSPYAISDVSTNVQDANGMRLAVVSGTLTNLTDGRKDTPRLLIKSATGQQLGVIEPAIPVLEAHASQRFAGRIRIAGGKSTGMMIIPDLE